VLGVLLFDADVLDQVAPRHVFTDAVAVADLLQVHAHEARKLFDGRPHPDQEALLRGERQLGVAHQREQFVVDTRLLYGAVSRTTR